MARPKNQAARRLELVSVTSELLVERGASGARLTDIATAAGLTPAAVTYYYPNLVELYADTYATATQEYVTKRRESVDKVSGAVARLVECLRLGVPRKGTSSYAATVLLIELAALESREPAVALAGEAFGREQVRLIEAILAEGEDDGVFRPAHGPAAAARAILALEDGLAPSVISGRLTPEESLELTLAMAGTLVGAELAAAPASTPPPRPPRLASTPPTRPRAARPPHRRHPRPAS
ncbi:TetR/AcrR family transcriptional regulator [Sinomonas sp. ASV322]|uniref:TetR/AcrR family transcriptional regulator n=1 Tax=Sinomonas sp. ASV322 TaxID=3041920 RepID=UPI0027DDB291|nr:TetR/AcrR family transcriptional regulator [Sinomonas sp. ASV322]MDQ4503482.1 TetR/AcrR family transcriptional regulator [Sinomonas sp. ASV322]